MQRYYGGPSREGVRVFRSCLFRLLALLLVPLLLVSLYEAVALVRAARRTPAALASVASRPLKLADLPQRRRAWLLAVEDPGFYRHKGVDFATPGQGMTSLTQSLVKFLYFDHFTPGFAKLEQSLIARFVLDPAVPKDVQLEIFLNQARFGTLGGRPVIGFADAARSYFGRPLAALNDREYLSLVAMLMAPNELDPIAHRAANEARIARILALLRHQCRPRDLRDVRYEDCG
jgi:membrane peptidoglycan carboxypeptidase